MRTSGLTGAIEFDPEGFRTDFSLDIVELLKDGLKKVGYWTLSTGANYTRSYGEKIREIEHSLWNKTLKVIMAVVSGVSVQHRHKKLVFWTESVCLHLYRANGVCHCYPAEQNKHCCS